MDKADPRCSPALCAVDCMASTVFILSHYWTKFCMVSWISFATPLQCHLICFLLRSNYFVPLIVSEQINSVYKLWLFLSKYFLQWTVCSWCSSLSHQWDMPRLDGIKRKVFFSLLAKWFSASPTRMGKTMIPLCCFFIWALLFAQSLFSTYFVHCQFKPSLIWNSIAHAQCICNVFIRSHLEDVPVITNTFAFQSHQLQARSLGPHPHPSTLRNPEIPESCKFTHV